MDIVRSRSADVRGIALDNRSMRHLSQTLRGSALGLNQLRVIVSCRFKITRATEVQAANSGHVEIGGGGASPTPSSFFAAAGRPHIPCGACRTVGEDFDFLRPSAERDSARRNAQSIRSRRLRAPLLHDPHGEHARGFDIRRIVQQHERLQRRVRARADRRCIPRASARRTLSGWDARTSAATRCTARGDIDSRRDRSPIRASENSNRPNSRPVDTA